MTEYVEGYGVKSEGEVYHPSAFFNPTEAFKFAGDPEKQAAYQEEVGLKIGEAVTDEQSNSDSATSTVTVGDQEIETKKSEVVITPEGEDNLKVEGPTGTVIPSEDTSEGTTGVEFQ